MTRGGRIPLRCDMAALPTAFRFASTITSHAVLQAAPSRAVLWGFSPDNATVTVTDDNGVTFIGAITTAAHLVGEQHNDTHIWRVVLPAITASMTPHSFTAASANGASAKIHDVLFGDVWVCSGQSNMAYSVNGSNGYTVAHPPVNDSRREIADMADRRWRNIRLLFVEKQASEVPMLEAAVAPSTRGDQRDDHEHDDRVASDRVASADPVIGWSEPCPNATCRVDFSAVCFFFGRDISDALARAGSPRPVGLIGTYWGGKHVEAFSSQDALDKCIDPRGGNPHGSKELWNGMIHPLLNQTIRGVVWYQGEANRRNPGGEYDGYNCTFPAMITDWRSKWHAASGGETAVDFPFGFVQLNSRGDDPVYNSPLDPLNPFSDRFGFAGLRWSQSAGYGYAPNPAQPNVFMAVSVDTPDRPYPVAVNGRPDGHKAFNVHSPFKQPVAARLARACLHLVYRDLVAVDTPGPRPGALTRSTDNTSLLLEVVGLSEGGEVLPLRTSRGFEVSSNSWLSWWRPVPARRENSTHVRIGPVPTKALSLRYNWYSNPCGEGEFGCAVYVSARPIGNLSGEEPFLPLPPFIVVGASKSVDPLRAWVVAAAALFVVIVAAAALGCLRRLYRACGYCSDRKTSAGLASSPPSTSIAPVSVLFGAKPRAHRQLAEEQELTSTTLASTA